jgi:alpha-D-xyloside xylohydrolase
MNSRKISFLVMLLFAVANSSAQSIPEWKMIHPGIWKAVIGKPENMTLLSVADARPNVEAIAKTTKW